MPLLVQYVRLLTHADTLAAQIKSFDSKSLRDDDGLQRYAGLLAMYARTTGQVKSLATTLRLTQQANYSPKAAGRAASKFRSGHKPWQSVEADA